MISQTAQSWSKDCVSDRFEVGEQEFDFWHQKMSVWLCLSVIIMQFVVWTILDAYKSHVLEKSFAGARLRFGIRIHLDCLIPYNSLVLWCCDFLVNVLFSFVFKNLSKLKSGKECDGFVTLVNGADFRRDDRCFIGFLLWSILCFLPFKKTWLTYWMTVLGVFQKLLNDIQTSHPQSFMSS